MQNRVFVYFAKIASLKLVTNCYCYSKFSPKVANIVIFARKILLFFPSNSISRRKNRFKKFKSENLKFFSYSFSAGEKLPFHDEQRNHFCDEQRKTIATFPDVQQFFHANRVFSCTTSINQKKTSDLVNFLKIGNFHRNFDLFTTLEQAENIYFRNFLRAIALYLSIWRLQPVVQSKTILMQKSWGKYLSKYSQGFSILRFFVRKTNEK